MKNILFYKKLAFLLSGFFLLRPITANALESTTGVISSIYISNGQNFAYRVYFAGRSSACASGTGGFAYMNEADSSYKVFVANLMMVYALGKTVNLNVEYVNGYCHILEVIF